MCCAPYVLYARRPLLIMPTVLGNYKAVDVKKGFVGRGSCGGSGGAKLHPLLWNTVTLARAPLL